MSHSSACVTILVFLSFEKENMEIGVLLIAIISNFLMIFLVPMVDGKANFDGLIQKAFASLMFSVLCLT